MANDLTKFPSGNLDAGIDIFHPDFVPQIVWHKNSFNVTTGLSQGIGPRYGITPIPGQSDKETIDPMTSSRVDGIMGSEQVLDPTIFGLIKRQRAFKLMPIQRLDMNAVIWNGTVFIQTVLTSARQYLHLICGDLADFDVVPQVQRDQPLSTVYFFTPNPIISQGFETSFSIQPSGFPLPSPTAFVNEFLLDASGSGTIKNALTYDSTKYYMSASAYTHPSKKVPVKWFMGFVNTSQGLSPGDATHAPDVQLTVIGVGNGVSFFCGNISPMALGNFDPKNRAINIWAMTGAAELNIQYSYSTTWTPIVAPNTLQGTLGNQLKFANQAGTKITSGTSYSNSQSSLINDDLMTNDASFSAIFTAADKPIATIFQDWRRNLNYSPREYFDMTADLLRPRTFDQAATFIPSAERYSEDGTVKNTAFLKWPQFITGTPMSPSTADGPTLGALNSGILRLDSIYEITYSYYNKRLDFESNVGDPVRVQTGSTDNVCIILSALTSPHSNAETLKDFVGGTDRSLPIWNSFSPGGTMGGVPVDGNHAMNLTEIRFYYRELGTFEWLPAGSFDAAQYWFYPNPSSFKICEGAVAGLPGGQPGGFNDYSPLPIGKYTSVVTFQNRVFWIGDKSVNFSYQNNPFAYPLRNTATVQTGQFKGAIIHNYPGEAQQTSRLIFFTTTGVYVGRFSGNLQQTAIQISPTTSAQFPLDGSDFTFDLWTTITSFSQRSAVNAEGTLYYWGPDGIFRDNGTETPDRISRILEPDFFTFYDPTQTDAIFSIYNLHTREIIWFYSPLSNPTKTNAIVYSLENQGFLFLEFNCRIDDASEIPLTGDNSATFGLKRTIISCRADNTQSIQRMFFFDFLNRSGDMTTNNEIMVKAISTPTAGQRRFTVAANPSSGQVSSIQPGDNICVQQLKSYYPLTTGSDFIGTVVDVDPGLTYIDVLLPSGLTFDPSATLDYTNFFPIMHSAKSGRGNHGITWNLESKYWLPGGTNFFARWLWTYFLYKYITLPKTIANTYTIGYKTPSSAPEITDIITFANNSDNNFQLYHALREGNLNMQGQALKLFLSGIQIGEQWILHYLEAQALEESGNVLKMYQG